MLPPEALRRPARRSAARRCSWLVGALLVTALLCLRRPFSASPRPLHLDGCNETASSGPAAPRRTYFKLHPHYSPNFVPSGPAGAFPPLTHKAQRYIHARQFPASCAGQKYLKMNEWWSGIGSQIHVVGTALAAALNSGRILVYSDNLRSFAHGPHCGDATNAECFFAPVTNCTPADGDDVEKISNNHRNDVLQAFAAELASLGYGFDEQLYWWRIQSVTFLTRLNAKTSGALAAKRVALAQSPSGAIPSLAGAAFIFVRHGERLRTLFVLIVRTLTTVGQPSGHGQGFALHCTDSPGAGQYTCAFSSCVQTQTGLFITRLYRVDVSRRAWARLQVIKQ